MLRCCGYYLGALCDMSTFAMFRGATAVARWLAWDYMHRWSYVNAHLSGPDQAMDLACKWHQAPGQYHTDISRPH